jgi:hypothetical protein
VENKIWKNLIQISKGNIPIEEGIVHTLRDISHNDNLHENAKSWFITSPETPPTTDDFFPFLLQRITGNPLTPEDAERTLTLIQMSAAWQESGIQPNWLHLPPQTPLNVPMSLDPPSPSSFTLVDMGIENAENSCTAMQLEDNPIPVLSPSTTSPPIDIQGRAPDPANLSKTLSAEHASDSIYPLVKGGIMPAASRSPPPEILKREAPNGSDDDCSDLNDNPMAYSHFSPSAEITESQAPQSENYMDTLEDNQSDPAHKDYPMAHASPLPPPEILERQASDSSDIAYPPEKDRSDLNDLNDNLMAYSHLSPPAEIVKSQAPQSENYVDTVEDNRSDPAHSLEDYPTAGDSPSSPPRIIQMQAPDSVNDIDDLSVNGDHEDQDNDNLKLLAQVLNKSMAMNASQNGLEASGNNPQLIKPLEEEVSFNTFFKLVFYKVCQVPLPQPCGSQVSESKVFVLIISRHDTRLIFFLFFSSFPPASWSFMVRMGS